MWIIGEYVFEKDTKMITLFATFHTATCFESTEGAILHAYSVVCVKRLHVAIEAKQRLLLSLALVVEYGL